jgi:hypothetical protein
VCAKPSPRRGLGRLTLASLHRRDLSQNSLRGTIPSEVGLLTQMTLLCAPPAHRPLASMSQTPEQHLLYRTSLRCRHLSQSPLSGTIPSEVWQLTQMSVLCAPTTHRPQPARMHSRTRPADSRLHRVSLSMQGSVPDVRERHDPIRGWAAHPDDSAVRATRMPPARIHSRTRPTHDTSIAPPSDAGIWMQRQ